MDSSPVGGRPLPFNIPTGFDAIKARDAAFWPAHATWRAIEDEFEAWPGFPDECPRARILMERAEAARLRMFSTAVRTASALSLKLEAVRETGSGAAWDTEVRPGLTVADVLEADVGRLVKLEMFGPAAFDDLANG